MAGINPPTIPIGLQRLFDDAGFLAAAEDNQKPNIRSKTYASTDSWVDWFWRRYDKENPDSMKVFVRRVCEELAQSLVQYEQTDFYSIILGKMVKLRTGLTHIADTYRSKVTVYDHLHTSILTLDLKIPEDIKRLHGFSTVGKPMVSPLGPGVVMKSSPPSASTEGFRPRDLRVSGDSPSSAEGFRSTENGPLRRNSPQLAPANGYGTSELRLGGASPQLKPTEQSTWDNKLPLPSESHQSMPIIQLGSPQLAQQSSQPTHQYPSSYQLPFGYQLTSPQTNLFQMPQPNVQLPQALQIPLPSVPQVNIQVPQVGAKSRVPPSPLIRDLGPSKGTLPSVGQGQPELMSPPKAPLTPEETPTVKISTPSGQLTVPDDEVSRGEIDAVLDKYSVN